MGIMGAIKPDWLVWPDRGKRAGVKFLNTARPVALAMPSGAQGRSAVKRHQRQPRICLFDADQPNPGGKYVVAPGMIRQPPSPCGLISKSRPARWNGAPILSAQACSDFATSGDWAALKQGVPGRMMPAFCLAIPVRLVPKKCSWSRAIGVIMVASGAVNTLVESSAPPSPVSRK